MKPRISVITIGVDDLERSVAFYRDGLGLPTEGIVGAEFEHGAVAFFDFQEGVKLALFSRANIAHDAGIEKTGRSATEFTLGHNVAAQGEVDAVHQRSHATIAHTQCQADGDQHHLRVGHRAERHEVDGIEATLPGF